MDRPRCAGGTLTTSLPSIRIFPELTSSSPAISRSRVDLPDPEGPTKTTNEPSSTTRSTFWITSTLLKLLFTPSSSISLIHLSFEESPDRAEPMSQDRLPEHDLRNSWRRGDGQSGACPDDRWGLSLPTGSRRCEVACWCI